MSAIEVPARFLEERRYRRRNAPVLRAAHSFVKLLPIVKENEIPSPKNSKISGTVR